VDNDNQENDGTDIEEIEVAEGVEETIEDEIADDSDGTSNEDDSDSEDDAAADDDTGGDINITIEGEEAQEDDVDTEETPAWVKDLRKKNRELAKENKKLSWQVQETDEAANRVEVGERPELKDHDFDTERYDAALFDWHKRKGQAEDQKRIKEDVAQKNQDDWDASLSNYNTQKTELGVSDYEDIEEDVSVSFSTLQQQIIIQGADNSAAVIYAVGKNKTVRDRLAKIEDPVKFAMEIGKLETRIKMQPRKKAPKPESRLNANGGAGSGNSKGTLAKLEKEAERTGDRSKITAYRRQLKAAS